MITLPGGARSRVRGPTCRRRRRARRETPLARSGRTRSRRGSRPRPGSPTPTPPKSITALSRPRSTSRLGRSRSVWIHTGVPSHAGASSAVSQAAVAASPSITPRAASIAVARDGVELAQRLGGRRAVPPTGAIRRSSATNCARSSAASTFVVDELVRVGLALDPAVDRPRERIGARRVALRDRLGDPQRQVRSEPGQPLPLLLQVPRPTRHARQPRAEVVAEPVDRVHRPGRRNRR